MGTLIFLCTRARKGIDCRLEYDEQTRSLLFDNPLRVRCPHCGEVHEYRLRQSYPPNAAA